MSEVRRLIRDGLVVVDDWVVAPASEDVASLPEGKVIVPLKLWQAQQEALVARIGKLNQPIGVWLDSDEDPGALAESIGRFAVIAVNFPKFADGRGYSIAALLRSRYGFKGELRAIGDVLRDQLFYLQRVGFNAFAVRADKDIHDAVRALKDFSEVYQGSINQPVPLFKRRAISPLPLKREGFDGISSGMPRADETAARCSGQRALQEWGGGENYAG